MNASNNQSNQQNNNQTSALRGTREALQPDVLTSYEAQKLAEQACAKALQAANPHLLTVSKEVKSRIAATKNIRYELKKAFPSVKFSVTSEVFAGGDAIRVRWTDGPTDDQVTDITNKYKAGSFDGMEDIYNYESTAWTDAFGDAKYVTTTREYSHEFITKAIQTIGAEFHDGELPTAEDYKQGRLYSVTPSRHCDSWQQMIYQYMRKAT